MSRPVSLLSEIFRGNDVAGFAWLRRWMLTSITFSTSNAVHDVVYDVTCGGIGYWDYVRSGGLLNAGWNNLMKYCSFSGLSNRLSVCIFKKRNTENDGKMDVAHSLICSLTYKILTLLSLICCLCTVIRLRRQSPVSPMYSFWQPQQRII